MNTTNEPIRSRVLVIIWLILSQLGGGLLALPVILVISTIAMFTLAGGGVPALFALACVSFLLPVGFSLAAWIAFARRKDKAASIFSEICLVIGAILYFTLSQFTKSFS